MPRPSKNISNSGTSNQRGRGNSFLSNIPLSGWLRDKKNLQKQKLEEAAKQVSNNKAENENTIVAILKSINFTESLLPADKLDYKSSETQLYGDLEYAVLEAIDMISNNTYDYNGIDLNKIDTSIIVIAKELKNAIETGDVHRAFAAQAGLITSIDKIRNKIPFLPEEMKAGFVETSESYLELWHTLITSCITLDTLQRNLNSQKTSIEQKQNQIKKMNEEHARKMLNDEAYKKKIERALNNNFIDNSQDWDQEIMDLYKWLVSQRVEQSSVKFEMLQYDMLFKQFTYQEKIVNDYQIRVRQLPNPEDLDLLNKYKDMVENEYKRASEIDAQFDELGEFMDNMDERLKQMAYSKGSIRQRKMVAEAIDKIVEQAQKIQLEEAGIDTDSNQMNALKKIKLLSETEIQKMKETQPVQEVEKTININTNKVREHN